MFAECYIRSTGATYGEDTDFEVYMQRFKLVAILKITGRFARFHR